MTLEDVRGLSLFQTRAVSEAVKDEQTGLYVVECLNRLFTGYYSGINGYSVSKTGYLVFICRLLQGH